MPQARSSVGRGKHALSAVGTGQGRWHTHPMTADPGFLARIAAIEACLPQTQCERCGYRGCRPYAEALARGETALNRCPPGGDVTIARLAALLDQPRVPLDPAVGLPGPRTLAWIEEADCIGCTLCIQACPVDAIIGAAKQMHTVLASHCTGCELCVPPCPTDCIRLLPADNTGDAWPQYTQTEAERARLRAQARRERLARLTAAEERRKVERQRREEIAAAVARVKARRAAAGVGKPGHEP